MAVQNCGQTYGFGPIAASVLCFQAELPVTPTAWTLARQEDGFPPTPAPNGNTGDGYARELTSHVCLARIIELIELGDEDINVSMAHHF